jgi:argininosuccinate synthase
VLASLLSKSGFNVHPIVVNLGQHSDFALIEKNAIKMFGQCHVVDGRQALCEASLRAIKANFGAYTGMNGGGVSRALLAFLLVQPAKKIGCQAIAHGASGTGNDHLTMENSLRVLAPEMRIIAPVRDLDMKRDEAIEFAKEHKLLTNLKRAVQFSSDENVWGRSIRQGSVANTSSELPEGAYKWTASPQDAPDASGAVEIEFKRGVATSASVEGKEFTTPFEILSSLNSFGGSHGVGRLDFMDDKTVGLKVREVVECPGVSILLAAHQSLESLVLTKNELAAKRQLDMLWGALVHDSGWYTRLRRSLDAAIDEMQQPVSGVVALELYKGSVRVKGTKSSHALYDSRLSGRSSQGVFSQKEARAYAKLHGLQDVIAYLMKRD